MSAAIAIAVALAGCTRGGDGLLDAASAAPLFEELHQEATRLIHVAELIGEAGRGGELPLGAQRVMENLGDLSKQVVDTVTPADAAGALGALERATRDAALAAGGHQERPDRITIRTIAVGLTPDQAARAGRSIEEEPTAQRKRERLRRRLEAAVQRLVYVALLADPTAQATLAPRISPTDLPPELPRTGPTGGVDPLLDAFDSVDQWRHRLFDDGQFVVPDPNADGTAWDAFLAWARYVNEDLAVVVRRLHDTFTRAFYQP